MKATNYFIHDVPDAQDMLSQIYTIESDAKLGIIGEIGFMLGCSDLEGGIMMFYVKRFGEVVQMPNKDDDYIVVITMQKLVTSVIATVIHY